MSIKNSLQLLLKYKIFVVLLLIVLSAFILRVYKVDEVPPAISWDEAANGYNAYTIANWGRDEYGKFFPPFFRSFADDKHPVHIYITALSIKIFGLSEFSTRLPAAILGALSILLIYYVALALLNNKIIGLFVSFFLAISPYHFHFSRTNHEAVFTLFFFLLGLFFFFKALKQNGNLFLPLSTLSFIVTFIAYHPSKVVVPFIILVLSGLWGKQLIKYKLGILISLGMVVLLILLIIQNLELLGIARVSQTALDQGMIKNTRAYNLTHNELLGRLNIVANQYLWHFSPQYFFISGDKNARLSAQGAGEFYKLDVAFLVLGMIYLLIRRSKEGVLLFGWAVVAPLPASFVGEAPHAARAMFMMGSFHLISAAGLYLLINFFKKKILKAIILLAVFLVFVFSFQNFLNYYFGEYAKRYAIEWQYGMKQIVGYVKQHEEETQVFMTDERSQPYIFFLYYLKFPLGEYLSRVIYNNDINTRSYNTVSTFDRFYFGGWDEIESIPTPGVLYILTPSQYDGLKFRSAFEVKKVIYYPNGTTAYYLVSTK